MKTIQASLIILIPLAGFVFLPSEVTSHFDASGAADATLPRTAFILLFTALSACLTFGPSFIARGLGSSFHRRIPKFLNLYGICFGVWTFLFWVLIIIANTIGHGHLSTTGTYLISIVLLAPIAVILLPQTNPNSRA